MTLTCLIVGASHAAAQLAPSLRQEGWLGRILVLADEPSLPYHRPPLSKAYLLGEKNHEGLLIRSQAAYDKIGVEFKLGVHVQAIDRSAKTVTLDTGECLSYDKLALCTGSRVRKVNLPGAHLPGVHYLRTLLDINRIKQDALACKHAVVVGGGYIGLEGAAVLRKLGMTVTVLEMAPRILARVTSPEMSEFFTRVHGEEGVSLRTGIAVEGFEGGDHVQQVRCADGTLIPADLVVVGIGILPNVELAQEAGLAVDNGILVDEYCRTSDPDIVAAGDCTNHPNALYQQRLRLESVPNATDQAKTAAASLCDKEKPYHSLPWFWSDQYDIKLQIVGLSQGYERIVMRGDWLKGRSFAAFYLKHGKVISIDCVNRPQEFMVGKRLVSEQIEIDPARLADETIAMKDLIPAQGHPFQGLR
ncbi:FAD/NAD(P)-binding oxidoreductase [Pseudomonas koreensis]|uniref:NAD(P)/FAD-dependent oxidoreductase n=1 Tax=Pseudomonas koreensis TaxID=198620 RepID=UPI00320B7B87